MATMILKSVSGEKQVELRGQIVAGRSEDADLVLTLGILPGATPGSPQGTTVSGSRISARPTART